MSDKQQSRREALAKRVYGAMLGGDMPGGRAFFGLSADVFVAMSRAVADFIIAEQERREGPLTRALRRIYEGGGRGAEDALATLVAYGRLDAPPQRTVEQIAADVDAQRIAACTAHAHGQECALVPKSLMDELAAALRRGKE